MAFYLHHNNIIEYYDLTNKAFGAEGYIIQSGTLELLKHLKEPLRLTLGYLLEYGYVDEVDKYDYDLPFSQVGLVISTTLNYNHIDALDYINKRFPFSVVQKIEQLLTDRKHITVNLTGTTFDYLFKHNILDIESVKNLMNEWVVARMSKYNIEALEYIESL